MEKLHMVKENLSLHHFAGQRGRKSVFVGFNGHKAAFVHRQRRIAEHHREWILRQAQIVLAPVKLVDIFLVGLEAVTRLAGNFPQTQAFICIPCFFLWKHRFQH